MQKNKLIAFLGFGELADQFINFLTMSSNDVIIFDDHLKSKDAHVFPFSDFKQYIVKYDWVVALGYKHLSKKLELINYIQMKGGSLKGHVHESSYVSKKSMVKEGVFIYPMCNLDKAVEIGEGSLINNSVVISHNTTIGKANYLSPGVILSGNVTVGDCTFMGSGAIISNGITIGDHVIIGPGSVITKDVPSGSTVIGNPMVFKENIQLS